MFEMFFLAGMMHYEEPEDCILEVQKFERKHGDLLHKCSTCNFAYHAFEPWLNILLDLTGSNGWRVCALNAS